MREEKTRSNTLYKKLRKMRNPKIMVHLLCINSKDNKEIKELIENDNMICGSLYVCLKL